MSYEMDSVRTLSLVLIVSCMVIICINLYDNEKSGVYQTMIGRSLGDKGKKHKCVMSTKMCAIIMYVLNI